MKKKFIITILIVLIITIIAVSTLAFFTWNSPNTTLTLEVGEYSDVIFQEGNDIIANNIGPVLNFEDGEITEFMIVNNSVDEQKLNINLNITDISETLKEESFKYLLQISSDGTNYTTYKEGNFINANIGKFIITSEFVLPSNTSYYRFIIYIDGNMENPISMMNNYLEATLEVSLYVPTITVAELVEQMKNSSNSGTPDFSQVATTDEGIYSAEDDYGTSYYFRGAVENNYVNFAGFYWRIIRANGDGTVRMIYDGTSAHANGESSTDRQIGTSAFNNNFNDNTYVGYMYGQASSSTYDATHANTNNSTVKTIIDNWYKTNIIDNGYGDYLADVIYCNDRSVYNGYGYSIYTTYYNANNRLITNKSPVLTCTNQNDRFTVNDTTLGNGALTYPVGLITVDEVAMAGGVYNLSNNNFYLSGSAILTMSPSYFNSMMRQAHIFKMYTSGNFTTSNLGNSASVNPVISLKSTVELSGSGTQNDPFVVQ